MIVEANCLSELLEKHGCIPNDYRHFESDIEEFYEIKKLLRMKEILTKLAWPRYGTEEMDLTRQDFADFVHNENLINPYE